MKGLGRIFKRKRSPYWYVEFRALINGERRIVQLSSKTASETEASAFLRQKLSEYDSGRAATPAHERVTFADLWECLTRSYEVRGHRSADVLPGRKKHLEAFFGRRKATEITSGMVSRYILERKREEAANGTINRELSALARAFSVAIREGLLTAVHRPIIEKLPEAEPRQGFVTPEQFEAIARHIEDESLRDAVRFLYLSGWRSGEMKTLTWRDVSGDVITLRPENSKNKRGRTLACAGPLLDLLERVRARRVLACPFVFHRKGHPIGDFRKVWRHACKLAGRPATLIHDLRRSAVRNMVQAGVPTQIAMSLSGHVTASIFGRYNIIVEADQRRALEQVAGYLGGERNAGTFTGTEGSKGQKSERVRQDSNLQPPDLESKASRPA